MTDEHKKILNVFSSTRELQKIDTPPDTASQKSSESDQSQFADTLNTKKGRSKDDFNVSYQQLNSPERKADLQTFEKPLETGQRRRGFYDISRVMDIDERLNQINRKITDDYLKGRGVDPKEFRDTGKKLHDYLEASIEGKSVSNIDYAIASKKFNSMVNKLGDIDKKIGRDFI